MKKIMFAMLVAGAACFANAAAVDWSASWVDSPWTGKTSEGWVGYMITAANYGTVTADLANGDTASLISSAVGPVKYVNNKGGITAGTAEGNVPGGKQTMYMIVLNAKVPGDATYYYANSVEWDIDASLDTTVQFGKQSKAADVTSWTAMSVPEPTSGLLLLLGVAGLALRRKRA